MVDYSMGLDGSVFRLANAAWANPLLDSLMPVPSRAWNAGMVWLASLGGIVAFGRKTGRRVAYAGLVALAVGFASAAPIKGATVRPEPFAVLPDARACSSGHTTSAFAAASGAVPAAGRLLRRAPAWGWGMPPRSGVRGRRRKRAERSEK